MKIQERRQWDAGGKKEKNKQERGEKEILPAMLQPLATFQHLSTVCPDA